MIRGLGHQIPKNKAQNKALISLVSNTVHHDGNLETKMEMFRQDSLHTGDR